MKIIALSLALCLVLGLLFGCATHRPQADDQSAILDPETQAIVDKENRDAAAGLVFHAILMVVSWPLFH